jgi:hypothetical protein
MFKKAEGALMLMAAALLLFGIQSSQADKSTIPTAQNSTLQFTSGGHVLSFAADGVHVASGSHALHVEFVNARATTPASDAAASETQRAAPMSKVTYPNLWNGVTLSYDAPRGAIVRSTYRLDPYANADNIRLRYNAPVSVQSDGSLQVSFQTSKVNESAPKAWQERDGKRVPVQIAFTPCDADQIRFAIGEYDRAKPLFIDPTLTWNTFLGSSGGDDFGNAVAVDRSGNVYVVGYSFATWGSPVRAFSGVDNNAFVAKLDTDGNLIWNTFLGSGADIGYGVAVDGSGNVYVAGSSSATWGSPVHAFTSGEDAFAAKLDSNGNLIWNTFLGSSAGIDAARAVAVDGSGNIYLAGDSGATWGSPVRAFSGGLNDAFAAKLDSNGNLTWNTFLGGSSADEGDAVTVDGNGNIYVGGYSSAAWGSPMRAFSVGNDDGFAAKLDSNGILTWNTFLGSAGSDSIHAVAVDGSGNVYVAGSSSATWGSPVRAFSGGNSDGFAAKLDSSGALIGNTFLGGSGDDFANSVAVDGNGNVYVAGYSTATWGSPARAFSGGFNDAFAAKLDLNGNLTWSTFLGGSDADVGLGVTIDGADHVYVAGYSLAAWGSPVRAYAGGYDAFVANLFDPAPPVITSPLTATATVGQIFVYQITATSSPTSFGAAPLPPRLSLDTVRGIIGGIPTNPGTTQIQLSASNSINTGMATLTLTVQPAPSSGPVITSGTSITARTGVPFSFEVFTTGGSPTARLSATGLPPGLSVDPVTGVISGIPTADGSFGVTLTVTDGVVTNTSTLQLTFTSDPAIPVIISPREATLTTGQFFTYTIVAPGSNPSDPTSYSLIGILPRGLGFDPATGTISGTFSVYAQNGGALLGNVQLVSSNSSGTATSPLSFFQKVPGAAVNISTRLAVGTSDDVLIGGFIVTGNAPKKVIVRAVGPELTALGVPGALQDTTLELHDGTGVLIATNDDWKTTVIGGAITEDQSAAVQTSGAAPTDDRESAVIATLDPYNPAVGGTVGLYTAIVRGKDDTTGVASVELYDLGTASLDVSSSAQLANISTRGVVQTGDDVMIGGFIVRGDFPATVIVRAIGPSLTAKGVSGALQDTTLELHDGTGALIGSNDNWQDDPGAAQIQADNLAPTDPRESATIVTLAPGNYTAIVRGANNTTGVALVEAYVLQ